MNTPASKDVTVLDLPFFDVKVSDTTMGSEVARLFEQNRSLPGIMVMHRNRLCGMVARGQFFQRLGKLYGIEIFATRPITTYLDSQPSSSLTLPAETTIQTAITRCLARQTESLYDPFVVTVADKPPRLVDFLVLILKQSELLTVAHDRLDSELAEAAGYVRSLLPSPLTGEIETQWCYLPSSELGGDGFGYHWVDADTLAFYLLDVSGHGVGSALLSSSVLNVLRTQSLGGTDFHDPSAVLAGLNRTFPMASNNDKYFTIWYGSYHRPSRTLSYASGGHHAAILICDKGRTTNLKTKGAVIGVMADLVYPSAKMEIPVQAELCLFSDGVYEIVRPDGTWQTWDEFAGFIQKQRPPLDAIVAQMRKIHATEDFDDDFSILRLKLN